MTKEQLIKEILDGENEYYSLSHFKLENMKDYTLMASTIKDIATVYGFNEAEAGQIVEALTH